MRAFVVACFLVSCTNDYDQFDYGAPPPSDAARDRSADAGRAGSDAAADRSADVVRDTSADVSDAPTDSRREAEASADAADADASLDHEGSVITDGAADRDGSMADGAPDARDGGADVEAGCGPGKKPCGSQCVALDDPATGCAGSSCSPCGLPHATAICGPGGLCAIGVCGAGFENCDGVVANGCEALLVSDVENCGACGRVCSGAHVLSKECVGGICASSCELGFANCLRPLSGADDGCERAVGNDNANCGGCGNDCTVQGSGLTCGSGGVPGQCGCTDNMGCRSAMGGGGCNVTTGRCLCGPTTCRPGETCQAATMGPDVCACNGGSACGSNQTCCQTPSGCKDLQSDPGSCGACGRACPNGFFCANGRCECNADGQCNNGSGGTCSAGQCVCNGVTCAPGQRCLPGARCG
ncbi:MAG TPA: hypothetical protein VF881_07230 [Polyangiaceae bacterium]